MKTSEYQTGDRIYYTGDMANEPGEGIIVKRREADRFASISYDIHMDDGRDWKGVYHLSFEASPGRRFWLLTEWQEDRNRRIAEMQERYGHPRHVVKDIRDFNTPAII